MFEDKSVNETEKESKVSITGEAIAGIGVTSDDFIWKKANWDLNELDWRMRSETAHDNKENTYDPGIYDRLQFTVDVDNEEGFSFHTNVCIDPWSFVGKSQRITIGTGGAGSDLAEIELKYWSNTGYTINESVYTFVEGSLL